MGWVSLQEDSIDRWVESNDERAIGTLASKGKSRRKKRTNQGALAPTGRCDVCGASVPLHRMERHKWKAHSRRRTANEGS